MSEYRLRKDDKPVRERLFNIRCTEAELVMFKACAESAGFENVAPYIRKLVADDYRRNYHKAYQGVLQRMIEHQQAEDERRNAQIDNVEGGNGK